MALTKATSVKSYGVSMATSGTLEDAVNHVTPEMYGSIQEAIDANPGGTVRLAKKTYTEQVTIRSGTKLVGSGLCIFDGVSWSEGSLIVGSVSCSDAVGFTLEDFSVDGVPGNMDALFGTTPGTGKGEVHRVGTRSLRHGQLWEANDNNPLNSNAIGGIVVKDCKHWGGSNGFVTKHKDVSFVDCVAYDVVVQSFVVASDNINGAGTYSRATGTRILNCSAHNNSTERPNNEGLRIYSREYVLLEDNVLGTYDTIVDNFDSRGAAGSNLRVGELSQTNPQFKRVVNSDIKILNMPYNFVAMLRPLIRLDSAARVLLDGCTWGNQKNVDLLFDQNSNIVFGNNIIKIGAAPTGAESGVLLVTDGAVQINPTGGEKDIIIRNTVATNINNIAFGVIGRKHTVYIDDQVTTVLINGYFRGKGTSVTFTYDGTTWLPSGYTRGLSQSQFNATSLIAGGSFDYAVTRRGLTKQLINISANLTSITASDLSTYLTPGDIVYLTVRNLTAGPLNISGWSIDFANMSGVPTSLNPSFKLQLMFMYSGGALVLQSMQSYNT